MVVPNRGTADAHPGGTPAQSHPTDAALWSRLRDADATALTELFHRHSRSVYNFAFRRTASWAAAEDVVQATFTALWRRARAGSIDALRRDSAVAVLLVMAGQECANSARSSRRQRLLSGRIVSVTGSQPDGDHASEAAARVDDERRMSEIHRALQRIPRVQREAIELVAWSGCTLAEAASALNVSEGTIKSRLHRARNSLRDVIDIGALKEALS